MHLLLSPVLAGSSSTGSPHWHLRLSIEPPQGRRYVSVRPADINCESQLLHMSRIVRIFQVDAFTATRFSGNPAGVVLDAQLLSDAEMQAIARELNNGDTAFVLPPTAADHDVCVRFFTPRREAPFVGHATLAVHAVLAQSTPVASRRQRGITGVVEVQTLPARRGFSIRQPAPQPGRILAPGELDQVLSLLGLSHEQLDPACPAQV